MPKLRVFIVENESLLRLDAADTLTTLGHDPVGWAVTVPGAIADAERLRPDLVLMDIQLHHGGDGTEAARVIKERFNIPSLFMTAGADPETWQRAMATQPLGYLQKPFLAAELAGALAKVAPLNAPVVVATTRQAIETAATLLTSACVEPPATPATPKAASAETETA